MANTPNLNLIKPASTDTVDVTDLDTNLSRIEEIGNWQPYTFSLFNWNGNITSNSRFCQIGNLVWFKFRFVITSPSTITDPIKVSLPVASNNTRSIGSVMAQNENLNPNLRWGILLNHFAGQVNLANIFLPDYNINRNDWGTISKNDPYNVVGSIFTGGGCYNGAT